MSSSDSENLDRLIRGRKTESLLPQTPAPPKSNSNDEQPLPVHNIPDTEHRSYTTWIYVSFSMAAVLVIIIAWLCYIKYKKRSIRQGINLENNSSVIHQPTSIPAYTGKKTHISRFFLTDAGLDQPQKSIKQPRYFISRPRSHLSRTLDTDDSESSEDDKELKDAIDSIIVPSIFWKSYGSDFELSSDFDSETAELNILQN